MTLENEHQFRYAYATTPEGLCINRVHKQDTAMVDKCRKDIAFAERQTQYAKGLPYDTDIISRHGCRVVIFANDDTSKDDMKQAIREVYADHDVLSHALFILPEEE